SDEVPPLEQFLGDMRFFMDLVADQGPKGMEFIPGRSVYSYRGNWKLQLDNGLDPYHLTTTHLSYMDLQARRRGGEGHPEARQFEDFFNPGGLATPDDTVTYEGCQSGFGAQPISFLQGYARGMAAMKAGADEAASAICIRPEASVRGRFEMFSEVGFHAPYRE